MSDENLSLTSTEQRIVIFYDDELIAVRGEDGNIYVAINQMCQALGIDRRSQTRRIQNNEVLADGYRITDIIYPNRGSQQSNVLRVDLIPLWLTGIRIKAVKEEVQPKLRRFQKEAAKALWEAFQEGRLTPGTNIDELLETDSPAAQAYRMATAIAMIARHQLVLEDRVSHQETRITSNEKRLELIETQLGDESRSVSQEQAVQISQAVKAIAMIWSKQSGKNEYGAVYGRFYEQFKITSYKLLPARKFKDAMNWLTQWYTDLTDDSDVPF